MQATFHALARLIFPAAQAEDLVIGATDPAPQPVQETDAEPAKRILAVQLAHDEEGGATARFAHSRTVLHTASKLRAEA